MNKASTQRRVSRQFSQGRLLRAVPFELEKSDLEKGGRWEKGGRR